MMKYSPLGRSGLDVSRVCLGTMTWGQQNTEEEAHAQMDYAVERGVNFFDTAELYPIPILAETQGRTEEMIGTWLSKGVKRDKVVLASKVAGPGVSWIREGEVLTGESVRRAIEGSLQRLQTDYVDLYQLHWPNRPFPHFGRSYAGAIDFAADDTKAIEENLRDILTAMGALVKEGKVRHFGLSDDSAWGISAYLRLSEAHDLPRVEAIQNEFSLLNRSDDPYVAEVCVRDDVAYLPWSPLAAGILSGKYQGGENPPGSRGDVEVKLGQKSGLWRMTEQYTHEAVEAYLAVAKKHGLDPCQMALKFVDAQSFVTSTIIGATSMEQLKSNIDAFDLALSDEVIEDIDAVYRQYPLLF